MAERRLQDLGRDGAELLQGGQPVQLLQEALGSEADLLGSHVTADEHLQVCGRRSVITTGAGGETYTCIHRANIDTLKVVTPHLWCLKVPVLHRPRIASDFDCGV